MVVGPLSVYAEPHTYDLCDRHAASVTPPRGWEVLRLNLPGAPQQVDDLLALADAVRESPQVRAAARAQSQAGRPEAQTQASQSEGRREDELELPTRSNRERMAPPARAGGSGISRGHLRLIDG
ncbi:DUF3499 domain-containing protein [Nesterenkonia lutea]